MHLQDTGSQQNNNRQNKKTKILAEGDRIYRRRLKEIRSGMKLFYLSVSQDVKDLIFLLMDPLIKCNLQKPLRKITKFSEMTTQMILEMFLQIGLSQIEKFVALGDLALKIDKSSPLYLSQLTIRQQTK